MVALPVIELEKFPVSTVQDSDVTSNVPLIEEGVTVALKEAVPDPAIFASKLFPLTFPETVPSNVQPVPITVAEPVTEVDPSG